jgi:hypothetical protein
MVMVVVLLTCEIEEIIWKKQDVETVNSSLSSINRMLCPKEKGEAVHVMKQNGAGRPARPILFRDGPNLLIYEEKLECHTGLHPLQ